MPDLLLCPCCFARAFAFVRRGTDLICLNCSRVVETNADAERGSPERIEQRAHAVDATTPALAPAAARVT